MPPRQRRHRPLLSTLGDAQRGLTRRNLAYDTMSSPFSARPATHQALSSVKLADRQLPVSVRAD